MQYEASWPKWLLLQTPNFLFDMFEERRVDPGGRAMNNQAPVPRTWGGGQTLGR